MRLRRKVFFLEAVNILKMLKPRLFKLDVKPMKIPKIFRPREPPSPRPAEMSDDARQLWQKNEKIIRLERDVNANNVSVDERQNNTDLHELRFVVGNVNEIVIEISSKLIEAMKDIFRLAQRDPSYLKVCFEIIEIQRKIDENAKADEEFQKVFYRPLEWEHTCFQELRNVPSGRLKDPSDLKGEELALCLQQNLKTISSDLAIIRKFVDEHQQEDDYVFRNIAVAYKDLLSRMMEDLCKEPVSETHMNSILLFLGEFGQTFPKSRFVDFWQGKDEKDELSIVNLDMHRNFLNRYSDRQSTVIQEQLSRCLEIEINLWLSGEDIESHNLAFRRTQWPVDVADLCFQNLKVSRNIGFGAYEKMHSLLSKELPKTLNLYACAAKYFIKPSKLSQICQKCPSLVRLKNERKTMDDTTIVHQHATYAILNNFSLLHRNLSSLSDTFRPEELEGVEKIKNTVTDLSLECLDHFKSVVFYPTMEKYSEQLITKAWFRDSSITDEFCDVISTFICALDRDYFIHWQEEVKARVHLAYLNAICKTCKKFKCKSDEEREKVARRLTYENRRIGETLNTAIPDAGANYVDLLGQIVDVIESSEVQSCETSVAVLKHQQQKLVTKEHLKSILILQGIFTSSNKTKKIVGSLFQYET